MPAQLSQRHYYSNHQDGGPSRREEKRKLDKYIYDLGSCTFCELCVTTCPQDAIEFSNDFEQAVFTREKLVEQLNYLPEQPDDPAPKPTAPKPAAPEAKAE